MQRWTDQRSLHGTGAAFAENRGDRSQACSTSVIGGHRVLRLARDVSRGTSSLGFEPNAGDRPALSQRSGSQGRAGKESWPQPGAGGRSSRPRDSERARSPGAEGWLCGVPQEPGQSAGCIADDQAARRRGSVHHGGRRLQPFVTLFCPETRRIDETLSPTFAHRHGASLNRGLGRPRRMIDLSGTGHVGRRQGATPRRPVGRPTSALSRPSASSPAPPARCSVGLGVHASPRMPRVLISRSGWHPDMSGPMTARPTSLHSSRRVAGVSPPPGVRRSVAPPPKPSVLTRSCRGTALRASSGSHFGRRPLLRRVVPVMSGGGRSSHRRRRSGIDDERFPRPVDAIWPSPGGGDGNLLLSRVDGITDVQVVRSPSSERRRRLCETPPVVTA
jgi:hypothetical protein